MATIYAFGQASARAARVQLAPKITGSLKVSPRSMAYSMDIMDFIDSRLMKHYETIYETI